MSDHTIAGTLIHMEEVADKHKAGRERALSRVSTLSRRLESDSLPDSNITTKAAYHRILKRSETKRQLATAIGEATHHEDKFKQLLEWIKTIRKETTKLEERLRA